MIDSVLVFGGKLHGEAVKDEGKTFVYNYYVLPPDFLSSNIGDEKDATLLTRVDCYQKHWLVHNGKQVCFYLVSDQSKSEASRLIDRASLHFFGDTWANILEGLSK